MKPAPFEYHRPRSIDEVLDLLARYGEDCRILAGGQSLVPLMNMRMMSPPALISINHCDTLDTIICDDSGIAIGARTRQAAIERHADVRRRCRLLHRTLPLVGTMANRNRGTVCGSLAHNDPSAELPTAALALDAELVINGKSGLRRVAASEFFISELATCVEPDEYLEQVVFPLDAPNAGAAFVEVGVRAHGFAIAGVAAQIELDAAGSCRRVRLAGMGFGGGAIRLSPAETIVEGATLGDDLWDEVAAVVEAFVDPASDIHADADYRRHLSGVLAVRALREAVDDARHSAERSQ